jgi:hypothetical protein
VITRTYETTNVPGRATGFNLEAGYAVTYGYEAGTKCPFGKPAQGKKRVKNAMGLIFFWSGHYRRAIYHPEGG